MQFMNIGFGLKISGLKDDFVNKMSKYKYGQSFGQYYWTNITYPAYDNGIVVR